VSSLESNKVNLEAAEFNLGAAVREATEDAAAACGRGVHICSLLDPSLPDQIAGDAARLKSTVRSLIDAGVSSTGPGEVKLSVFPSGQSGPVVELTFEVTLSPYAELPVPADQTPATSNGSLEAAQKMAEKLGGELGIHSQRGATPVFWLRLPVQQVAHRRPAEDQYHSSGAVSGQDGASSVRILMAEDNSINQRVGKLILQRAGYRIDLVSDGNEAVEAHRGEPYDMILMDCQMPTMDGFEATRRIRAGSQRQPVIIAVTANALVGERERCLAAGMDDYLSKPFQAEQLIGIVEKWSAAAIKR
jgi:CheY-like chemotaxis protein